MATLTQTAYISRKIIKYGSIGLVCLLILRSIFISFRAYWKKSHPPPPPPPTVSFGILPKLKFPARPNLPPVALKLETISGSLPKLPDRGKVFFMPQAASNLLAWDNTKTWARSLGFSREPETIGKFDFRFTTETTPATTLDVNVLTRNFLLVYDWKNDLGILSQGNLPVEDQAINQAKGFLEGAGISTEDLTSAETIYLKYKEGNLTKTLFSSEANFVKVNLFRQSIDDLRILPPNPKDSNIFLIISSSTTQGRSIIEVKYIRFPISFENFGTYPLKDTDSAWSQLANGKGFIANLGNNPDGKVTVRNAYVSYYDSDEPQNFLQPVIVFEGDNDFFAMVPAVTDKWQEQ